MSDGCIWNSGVRTTASCFHWFLLWFTDSQVKRSVSLTTSCDSQPRTHTNTHTHTPSVLNFSDDEEKNAWICGQICQHSSLCHLSNVWQIWKNNDSYFHLNSFLIGQNTNKYNVGVCGGKPNICSYRQLSLFVNSVIVISEMNSYNQSITNNPWTDIIVHQRSLPASRRWDMRGNTKWKTVGGGAGGGGVKSG